jgi:hypothetical protein
LPTDLKKTPIEFKVGLYNNNNLTDIPIEIEVSVENSNNSADYYNLQRIDNNTFTLSRKKYYYGNITVKCFVSSEHESIDKDLSQSFQMFLGGV